MRTDPTYWLIGLAGCLSDWLVTRAWKRILLTSLPLVFAIGLGLLVVSSSRLNRDRLAEHYLMLANAEVESWENQWAPKKSELLADGSNATPSESQTNVPASGKSDGAAGQSKEVSADDASDRSAKSKQGEEEPAQGNANATDKSSTISPYAELLFRRVQQLQQNDSRSVFFVAMGYLQRGATQQAFEMLSRLAPPDRIGYLPAHAFLAEMLLTRPVPANQLAVVVHHADATMRWDRAPAKLLAMISGLYAAINNRERAVAAMQLAADRDSQFLLPLARLASAEMRFKGFADQAMSKALTIYERKLIDNPRSVTSRIMYADALANNHQIEQAEALLVEGLRLEDSEELKKALSEIYCGHFVQTSRFVEDGWTGNIDLLEKAFRLDPNNGHVFEELAKLARFTGEAPNKALQEQLEKNLAEGRATSVTHMWLAERFLVENNYAEAIPHLEQAVSRDPKAARCWNNLAFCLNAVAPERRTEALDCTSNAIRLTPEEHDYHDTRGTILMSLGQPREAIASFERAIELIAAHSGQLPPQVGYHERLAEAYKSIGNQSMANMHTKIAVEIQNRHDAWLKEQKQLKRESEESGVSSTTSETAEPKPGNLQTTEPASTVPASTEPASTEPASTEPPSTGPQNTEPQTSDSKLSEPPVIKQP